MHYKLGFTPLHNAIRENNSEKLKRLIKKTSDVNIIKDKFNQSPLHYACICNRPELVEILITNGANVNIKVETRPLLDYVLTELPYKLASTDILGVRRATPATIKKCLELAKLIVEKKANTDISITSSEDISITGDSLLTYVMQFYFSTEQDDLKQSYFELIKSIIKQGGAGIKKSNAHNITPLQYAINGKNNELIKLLIENGIDVNTKTQSGDPILHLVINDLELAEFLIEKGADVNARDRYEKTALHLAAQNNNFELFKLLIQNGADVNARDRYEKTALHLAAQNNNFELFKLLIQNGANINDKDILDSRNSLYYAIKYNNFEMIEFIIQNGADINITTTIKQKITALHLAALYHNVKLAKFLIEKININARDSLERTPLHFATVKKNRNLDLPEFLIRNGAHIHAKDHNNKTPLHYALNKNNTEFIKLLIEKGADINTTDEKGNTALHLATQNNDLELTKFLIQKGADVNAKDSSKNPPLHYAAMKDNIAFMQLLIENGADVNISLEELRHIQYIDEPTRFRVAIKTQSLLLWVMKMKGGDQLAKLIIEKGADINTTDEKGNTALHLATQNNDLELTKFLIQKGADVNAKDSSKNPPLHYAAMKDNIAFMQLLIENGADVNISLEELRHIQYIDGPTRFRVAIKTQSLLLWVMKMKGGDQLAKLIIEKGADVKTTKDKDGETPLHCAVAFNSSELVELLLKKGAYINAKNHKGKTPLSYAIFNKNTELIKLLLENGAEAHVKDIYGNTPIQKTLKGNFSEEINNLILDHTDFSIIPYQAIQSLSKEQLVNLLHRKTRQEEKVAIAYFLFQKERDTIPTLEKTHQVTLISQKTLCNIKPLPKVTVPKDFSYETFGKILIIFFKCKDEKEIKTIRTFMQKIKKGIDEKISIYEEIIECLILYYDYLSNKDNETIKSQKQLFLNEISLCENGALNFLKHSVASFYNTSSQLSPIHQIFKNLLDYLYRHTRSQLMDRLENLAFDENGERSGFNTHLESLFTQMKNRLGLSLLKPTIDPYVSADSAEKIQKATDVIQAAMENLTMIVYVFKQIISTDSALKEIIENFFLNSMPQDFSIEKTLEDQNLTKKVLQIFESVDEAEAIDIYRASLYEEDSKTLTDETVLRFLEEKCSGIIAKTPLKIDA